MDKSIYIISDRELEKANSLSESVRLTRIEREVTNSSVVNRVRDTGACECKSRLLLSWSEISINYEFSRSAENDIPNFAVLCDF